MSSESKAQSPTLADQLAVLRQEIELQRKDIESRLEELSFKLRHENNLTAWLFLAVIGAVGLVPADRLEIAAAFMNENVWLYLVVAILLLWFPALSAIAWADISKCYVYVREIGAPRLNDLVSLQRRLAGMPQRPAADGVWQSLPSVGRNSGYATWDAQAKKVRYLRIPVDTWMWLLCALRFWVLAVPSIIVFFFGYVPIRFPGIPSAAPWVEGVLLPVTAILVVLLWMAARISISTNLTIDKNVDEDVPLPVVKTRRSTRGTKP